MPVVLPIAANRRGACPTLDAPMQTGDGLLARIRIKNGRISPARLERLATIIGTYGNGVLEVTARGNVQVRGLNTATAAHLAREIRQLIDVETGLVVETPPLAGDDAQEKSDPHPVAAAIRAASEGLDARLGPKVTVVVDGDGQINLKALKADIRLVAVTAHRWSIEVGSCWIGITEDPVTAAKRVLEAIAAIGSGARATELASIALKTELDALLVAGDQPAQAASTAIGSMRLRHTVAVGLGLPFGAIAWQSIGWLASRSEHYGIEEFRFGPHHTLLAIGGHSRMTADAAHVGYIVDPSDPRLRISACIGSDGCASGQAPARSIAAYLAPYLAPDTHLHISGCAKGCARPSPSDITLVGRSDGFGLVMAGMAGDTPVTVLRPDQLESVLATCQG